MRSYDLHYHITVLKREVTKLQEEITELKGSNNDELWDNSDMMKNWKVSQRTLATWRSEGLIEYVQVGSKIWYTRKNREHFLERNLVKKDAE